MEEQIPAAPLSPTPATPMPNQPTIKLNTFLIVVSVLVLLSGAFFTGLVLGQRGFLSSVLPFAKPSPTPALVPTPTPDPTTDWQTYTNTHLGISLKHPKEYFVKRQGLQSAEFHSQLEESDLPKLNIIKGFVGGGGCEYMVSSEGVIVGGEKGELTITTVANAGPECKNPSPVPNADYSARVALTHKQTLWFLEMIIKAGNKEKEVKTFKTILSTFKFLDKEATENTKDGEAETIVVPGNWREFTDEDKYYGLKVSLSLPPGFSFSFSGSEWTIKNDSDSTELWDYSPRTGYDGGSRRVWYQKVFPNNKVVSVAEKNLNDSSYLVLSIEIPKYDDHGVVSGTQIVSHYLCVKDNIVHLITPVSRKAYSKEAVIPENIAPILASLKLTRTK